MPKAIREPIQVYLTPDERARLDQAAAALGVSRSEALRRGIEAVGVPRYAGLLRDLADEGYLTPAQAPPGAPPPAAPVAPLVTLLDELAADREDG
jgi:hypothetical protein